MVNMPWKWQNTRENKITKGMEKQNEIYVFYLFVSFPR